MDESNAEHCDGRRRRSQAHKSTNRRLADRKVRANGGRRERRRRRLLFDWRGRRRLRAQRARRAQCRQQRPCPHRVSPRQPPTLNRRCVPRLRGDRRNATARVMTNGRRSSAAATMSRPKNERRARARACERRFATCSWLRCESPSRPMARPDSTLVKSRDISTHRRAFKLVAPRPVNARSQQM